MENGGRRPGECPPAGTGAADQHPSASLARLRARLQERARVPALPGGWRQQSAMVASESDGYGGDFAIADLAPDGSSLQMVLVDTCGHGEAAVPAALQLAGALQGLLRAVAPADLLGSVNSFLLALPSDESIATAVQVELDLASGAYVVRSAGHPPALRFSRDEAGFVVDNARGTALGVQEAPELHESVGVLAPGESLLFYTDGVVEQRGSDIESGIAWLRTTAAAALAEGWDDAARRILADVPRGEDDRAVLIIERVAE